ncbi:MAG: serine hydrolase domain-containing protein [Xanthobacteraceae bacterium]
MNEHLRLQSEPVTAPEEVGLATAGLDRLSAVMQREVDTGHVPGVSMLIARRGRTGYRQDFGALRPGGPPMPGNAIFRIYSMTKPIVTVALMILLEEGKLFVADPIAKFIPELANVKVGVESDGKLDLVAAKRAITVHDLLRHTSGLTYAFTGNAAVQRRYGEAKLFTGDPANAKQFLTKDLSSAEFVAELAKLPLIAQPGDSWDYSHSTDVIGRLVEIVSGKTLGAFLHERIFTPLGMTDTSFYVPAEQYARLADPFPSDPDGGLPVQLIEMRSAPRFESGGGGLFSTMNDYARFAQALYQGGTFGGSRLIGRKTLEWMTSDHLGPNVRIGTPSLLQPGHTFGLGLAVRREAGMGQTPGTPGEFFWGGVAGTYFWVAPKEELYALMMVQAPRQRDYFRQLFRTLVYAALA